MKNITTNQIIELQYQIANKMMLNHEPITELEQKTNTHLSYVININCFNADLKIICSISNDYEIVNTAHDIDYCAVLNRLQNKLDMRFYPVD